jgi:DNA-directed RNA polymerase specialized sigma24 family protein
MKSSTDLIRQVESLEIAPEDREGAYRAISLYSARLLEGAQEFRAEIKSLQPATRRVLGDWRKNAEGNYYWGCLWRCLVQNANPSQLDVDSRDIKWIFKHLKKAERDLLKQRAESERIPVSTAQLSAQQTNQLVHEMKTFVTRMVNRKLRFVFKHDPGTDMEDLIQDIMLHAVRAIRIKENDSNLDYVLNYAKRAAHNHMVNLIMRYTRKKRARLASTSQKDREYLSIVVSWEGKASTSFKDQIRWEEDSQTLVNRIEQRLGAHHALYVRCVLGMSPEFDKWVQEWHRKDPQTLKFSMLGELARLWAELDQNELEQNIAPLLSKEGFKER